MATQTAPSEQSHLHLALPVEIVTQIFACADLESHFNLASTCRYFFSCAEPLLKRHQAAHRKYRVVSDLHPWTFLTLLRAIVADRVANRDSFEAWHVRSVEIWSERSGWDEWRPFMLEPPERFDMNEPLAQWFYRPEELEEYRKIMRHELHVPDDALPYYGAVIKQGYQSVIQTLVIALSPRLERIKFVRSAPLMCNNSELLMTLKDAITRCWEAKAPWPPGFRALRDFAVAGPSNTWLDNLGRPGEDYEWDDDILAASDLMTAILKLPAIDSVYFHYFAGLEGDPVLPLRCSSVKHLFLDGISRVEPQFSKLLLAAPRALKSLSIRGPGGPVDKYVHLAAALQPGLESMMLYNTKLLKATQAPSTENQCQLYLPHDEREPITSLENLRHLTMDLADLVSACNREDGTTLLDTWNTDRERCYNAIASALPRSAEVLVLTLKDGHFWEMEDVEISEECLIQLVRRGSHPRLKTIYIEEDPMAHPDDPWTQDYIFFHELVDVGEEHGVDVRVMCNPRPPRYHHDLPWSPRPRDLESSPSFKRWADGKWEVDPFKGTRRNRRAGVRRPAGVVNPSIVDMPENLLEESM